MAALPSSDAAFTPRKEFIPTQHTFSSFSLLTLSGPNLLRFYAFPEHLLTVIRRFLNQRGILTASREDLFQNFYEFILSGKPWSSVKNIDTEKLIVELLRAILNQGYVFLSTIDYGREADDRLALAFSKPQSPLLDNRDPTRLASNPNVARPTSPVQPGPCGSVSTLSNHSPPLPHFHPDSVKVPFAVTFASATTLRVISPPLHSTPAILQAVRGAWPRGVISEKTVADGSYEFRLRGYKWFQEDTFATDSLTHILTLLSSLDTHGFTLLTSMTLSSRSRVKDLWIFTGPGEYIEDVEANPYSVQGSANNSGSNVEFSAPNSLGHRRLGAAPATDPRLVDVGGLTANGQTPPLAHRRSISEGVSKPKPGLLPQTSLRGKQRQCPSPPESPVHGPSSFEKYQGLTIQLPSAVSSGVDMTGIGAGGHGIAARPPMPTIDSQPTVIYATDGAGHQECGDGPEVIVPVPAAHQGEVMFLPSPQSSDFPEHQNRPPLERRHTSDAAPQTLLSSAAFRDSAFSTGSGQTSGTRRSQWTGSEREKSCEVFIKWVGPAGHGDLGVGGSAMGSGIPEDIREEARDGEEEDGESVVDEERVPGGWTGEEGRASGEEEREETKKVFAHISAPAVEEGVVRNSEAGVIGVMTMRRSGSSVKKAASGSGSGSGSSREGSPPNGVSREGSSANGSSRDASPKNGSPREGSPLGARSASPAPPRSRPTSPPPASRPMSPHLNASKSRPTSPSPLGKPNASVIAATAVRPKSPNAPAIISRPLSFVRPTSPKAPATASRPMSLAVPARPMSPASPISPSASTGPRKLKKPADGIQRSSSDQGWVWVNLEGPNNPPSASSSVPASPQQSNGKGHAAVKAFAIVDPAKEAQGKAQGSKPKKTGVGASTPPEGRRRRFFSLGRHRERTSSSASKSRGGEKKAVGGSLGRSARSRPSLEGVGLKRSKVEGKR